MTLAEDAAAHVDFAGIHALSLRAAGYAVATKCLQVQAYAETRDPIFVFARRRQGARRRWSCASVTSAKSKSGRC